MKSDDNFFSFEKMEVWKLSQELVVDVYKLVKKFPAYETYGLSNQLRRAIVSVPSNIAEGNGRTSANEKVRFIEIAYSSLLESYNQLAIAEDLKYVTEMELASVKNKFFLIAKMLAGLRAKFKK